MGRTAITWFRAFEREKIEAKIVEYERELELIKEKANLLSVEKKGVSSKSHNTPRHRFPNFNIESFFQVFEFQTKLLN